MKNQSLPVQIRAEYKKRLKSLENMNVRLASEADVLTALRLYFALGAENEGDCQRGKVFARKTGLIFLQKPEILAYGPAFDAISAKYKVWPIEKWTMVNGALSRLDELLKQNPLSLEARFLRGAICSKLPSLFYKKQAAQDDFTFILFALQKRPLPPDVANSPEFIRYMLDFFAESSILSEDKLATVQSLSTIFAE